jgi:hypothetical protein
VAWHQGWLTVHANLFPTPRSHPPIRNPLMDVIIICSSPNLDVSILDGRRAQLAHLYFHFGSRCGGEAGIVTAVAPQNIRNSSFGPINLLSETVLHVKSQFDPHTQEKKLFFVGRKA